MAGKTIEIAISNNGFVLGPNIKLATHESNIPFDFLRFRESDPIYWEVEMLEFDEASHHLKVKVLDFWASGERLPFQQPKKDIHSLEFAPLNWSVLEEQLMSFQKSKLLPVLDLEEKTDSPSNKFSIDRPSRDLLIHDRNAFFGFGSDKETQAEKEQETPARLKKETITETVQKSFTELKIGLGYASFPHLIKKWNSEFEFRVENENFLPEFDVIKPWFAKKLKRKVFDLQIEVSRIEDEILSIRAKCPEIEGISSSFIDSVKIQRTLSLTRNLEHLNPDKSLFTSEDIFDEFSQDKEGNVFQQSEEDILKLLADAKNIRNKKQLHYLAGHKQHPDFKLRYTLAPNFGFLFFTAGETKYHFIWELLNSNATYVWSVDKIDAQIERSYKRIENTINAVRDHGRRTYKQSYRNGDIDLDLNFQTIKHTHINSNLIDDFPKWKSRLNEQLV